MALPLYEPQSQAPGRGPGVEVSSGFLARPAAAWAALWNGLGQAGEKIAAVGEHFAQRFRQAQQVEEAGRHTMQLILGVQDVREQVEALPPVERPDKFQRGALELFNQTMGQIRDPQVRAAVGRHFSGSFPGVYHGVVQEAHHQEIAEMAGRTEQTMQDGVSAYLKARSPQERQQIQSHVFGTLSGAVEAGLMDPEKAEKAHGRFNEQITVGAVKQDIRLDPQGALVRLQSPEKYYPGVKEEHLLPLQNEARAVVHHQQQDFAEQLDQRFMRGTGDHADPNVKLPSHEDIAGWQQTGHLSGHDALRFTKILAGMQANPENKSDPATKTRLWAGIIPDDDGKISTTREMILNPQNELSANDRIHMLKDLQATGQHQQKAIVAYEHGQLNSIKNALGANYYQRFYNDYLKEKQAGNWESEEQIDQNISRIADPYLQRLRNRGGIFSQQAPAQPGFGTRIRNFLTGGGNGSTLPPAGTTRVLNKRSGQMETVTPEQFQQIQDYQRQAR